MPSRSGAISEIHLDYVQRTYERGCQIVGELGSIFWDFNAKAVRWYDAANKEWTTYAPPETWEINQMYVDEMKHFLDCLRNGVATTLPIPAAAAVMRIVFAAKTSSAQGKTGCDVEEARRELGDDPGENGVVAVSGEGAGGFVGPSDAVACGGSGAPGAARGQGRGGDH